MEITKQGFAVIENDTHIGKWVKENKRLDFDQNAIPLILKHININDFVVDAGANIGAYSYAFLKKANFVLSFESNPEAYECLKYNLKSFENSFCYNLALGSMAGKVEIVKDINAGASHCKMSPNGTVDMITIDSFNLQKCDFIKIDCEGFEVDILRGAIKTIQKFHPKMYIEVNRGALERAGATASDLFNFLDLFNYKYENIYSHEPMQGEQFDIICF